MFPLYSVPCLLVSLCVVDVILSLLYVAGCAAHDFDPGYTSWPVEHYSGYQSFFSCATGIFGVGRRPTHLPPWAEATSFAQVTVKTLQKPETALEKSLAPKVVEHAPVTFSGMCAARGFLAETRSCCTPLCDYCT